MGLRGSIHHTEACYERHRVGCREVVGDGEYTVFFSASVVEDMAEMLKTGAAPDYAIVAHGLTNEEAWGVAALLNARREGGYVLVTKQTVSDVKRDTAWWTLNACIAIAMQAGMMELAEAIEEMRELL